MKFYVIGLHDDYLDAYDQPTLISVPDLEDVKEGYRRNIQSNAEEAYTKYRINEKSCVLYGEFDDIKGKFELLESPKKLFECGPLFPANFINKKVSEAEERERQKQVIFQAQLEALKKGGSKDARDN